ncbi:hypothetical protein B0A54_15514 [Friedmanniomyces endolithicus]|uniref:Myb-like domain-containing protein n=1 Tax=Friedmanniomyces endolithicus TaxID=329885 RepID=A0A4U0U4D6_9PEZI|nr:hypothetical protein LTS09_013389 [Friedmanniomyces endolithicus]KAK0304060.1 hypothetical protein LTR01_007677 [Friedmanniomyces endolithicus]KAK0826804.1 hypothetical protein LTR73_006138 [Friedmanniomyces endolithicus]TKA29961.1 hypothetical protein B0A54_15514 [Friedmanniomyces endolithicus]
MQGKTDWDSAETWQRVVASMIATGAKPDLKAMAIAYGCTYDTLENRFRNIKKLAITLKQEIDSGERGEVVAPARAKSAPNTPRKPKTPKKDPLSAVANGRVSKASPSKRGGGKKEPLGTQPSSFAEAMGNVDMSSFVHDDEGEDYGFMAADLFDGMDS